MFNYKAFLEKIILIDSNRTEIKNLYFEQFSDRFFKIPLPYCHLFTDYYFEIIKLIIC